MNDTTYQFYIIGAQMIKRREIADRLRNLLYLPAETVAEYVSCPDLFRCSHYENGNLALYFLPGSIQEDDLPAVRERFPESQIFWTYQDALPIERSKCIPLGIRLIPLNVVFSSAKGLLYDWRARQRLLIVETPSGRRPLSFPEIYRIQAYKEKTRIFTRRERYISFLTISEAAGTLKPYGFHPVSPFALVNLLHVTTVENQFVLLDNQQREPLERKERITILNHIEGYLQKKEG